MLLLKVTKNGPKQHNKPFFCPKKAMPEGQSPPQELEVGPHSGPYLLVIIICGLILLMVREGSNYVLQWCSDALDPLALLVSH